ncbi:MAG TPA: NADP-dependent isocitrate dehydrogenase [Clostridiales bacterium]|jgi:isocitrate dehydrogenase|nr:NADP-dependent isocitrate dehydrogenase [Clostridiales bacterium]
MNKIKMRTPLVEIDGDEMTRVLWKIIKDELLLPYIELKTEYYDLGLPERDKTGDRITVDAAMATKKYGVAVKCATITPNKQRVEEYNLREMWKSPNATIRAILDGTVFRAPIIVKNIKPVVANWEKPITIARHAFGDVYKASEIRAGEGGTAELVFTSASGKVTRMKVCELDGPGVLQAMFNKDSSIRSFAHSCFKYALSTKQDLWFSTKDTISKQYDQTFKLIFEEIYNTHYRAEFERLGIEYFYTLIDDAASRVIRSSGGFIWACKNYDGDVMSDLVSTAFGSLAMMTSILVSPDGCYEYEAAHGTITRHYYRYLKGETPTSNPMALIFAWVGALSKRGEIDGIDELSGFAKNLKRACIETIEGGVMTKDLAALAVPGSKVTVVNTLEFITEIKNRLDIKQ